jgi:spoIIIJ-associated protein
MNPYERRIIHTAVQEIKGAISWSEGEGINRHVVIGPDPEYKGNRSYGGGYGNRSSYGDRGGRRPYDNNRSSGGYGRNNGRNYDSNRSSSYSSNGEKSEQRKPLNESVEGRTFGRIDK